MTREDRDKTYINAFVEYGIRPQMVVAIEEFSEAQKELCKWLRGKGNLDHIAEELADAQIMIEQMVKFLGLEEKFTQQMDFKVHRLDNRLRGIKDE